MVRSRVECAAGWRVGAVLWPVAERRRLALVVDRHHGLGLGPFVLAAKRERRLGTDQPMAPCYRCRCGVGSDSVGPVVARFALGCSGSAGSQRRVDCSVGNGRAVRCAGNHSVSPAIARNVASLELRRLLCG